MMRLSLYLFFFFFNDTATTEIYTLSLHDALPICRRRSGRTPAGRPARRDRATRPGGGWCAACPWTAALDRKSTRLNSSHSQISYAVFCLKKKKTNRREVKECVAYRCFPSDRVPYT